MSQLIKSFICLLLGHQWEQTKNGFRCKRCGKEIDFEKAFLLTGQAVGLPLG